MSADRRTAGHGRGSRLAILRDGATATSADALTVAIPADAAARAAGLIAIAEDLAGEFSLRPLLQRILLRCTELLGCTAGSICSVDEAAGTYRKEADIGVACQSGQVFPLSEGMTGAVVARRGPVWFDRYDQVQGGHVAAAERATLCGVIGVPLEWRGRVIGACVVFSRDERRVFGPDDAELLELFARHAAIALATARMHEEAEERARAEATASERDRLLGEIEESLGRRLTSIRLHLDAAEADLAETAKRAAELRRPGDSRRGPRLRVVVAAARPLLRAGVARLLAAGEPGFDVVGEAAATEAALAACRELEPDVVLADLGLPAVATVLLAAFPGLAVVGLCEAGDDALVAAAIRAGALGCVDMGADGPELARAVVAAARGQAILSGPVLDRLHRGLREAGHEQLTRRERQVRGLMELGLPDKVIAERLVLSIKTVEKHAGAVLRKTGARNRTELAAQANRARGSREATSREVGEALS